MPADGQIEVLFRMTHQSFPFVVLLLALAGLEGDAQIDPDRVMSLETMDRQQVAVRVFTYDHADDRGWPASAEDRQFVCFLQDNGVDVAFRSDEASDLHEAFIVETLGERFGSQFEKFLVLRQIAQENKGIAVPDVEQELVMVGGEPLGGGAGADLPWWLNAIMLTGTVAVLFWVYAVRDRPASSWGR